MIEAAAICAPGTETICSAEVASLGARIGRVRPGLVEFRAATRSLYSVLVWTRVASRILVRIGTFRATDFAHLEARAAELDWDEWLVDGTRPTFRVTTHKSRLFHTDAIAERLSRVAHRVAPVIGGADEVGFVARVDHDVFTISADLSGQGFHRRSWRADQMVAPLRPTSAAAVLLAIGGSGVASDESASSSTYPAICDPFAGSGTLAIEAALIAAGLPPDRGRIDWLAQGAFARLPGFAPGTWASVMGDVAAAEHKATHAAPVRVEAYDRDESAIEAIRSNAARAGVALNAERRVVSHLPGADGPGLVITNPPYGRRLAGPSKAGSSKGGAPTGTERLYRRFGAMLRERRPDWDLAVITSDRRLARRCDRDLRPLLGFGHGGLRVEAFTRPGRPAEDEPHQ